MSWIYSVRTDPGGDDVGSRSPDVDEGTEVGVGRLGVGNGGRTDSHGRGFTGGGEARGVGVGVTGCDDDVDTGGGERGDGTVKGTLG